MNAATLFVGDDRAEDHHDVELQDHTGRRLSKARLPEGVTGIAKLHQLIGEHAPHDMKPAQVLIGIETDRGPWVTALVAADYTIYAVNPRQVARFRERHAMAGPKSDAGDAHALAHMVRTDSHQLRPIAGDSPLAEGIKLLARAHQTLIWERQRHLMRLRAALRDYFPAALEAFPDLAGPDALELLERAPDPARAARLSKTRITTALRRANGRHAVARAEHIHTVLTSEQLQFPAELVTSYAALVQASCLIITAFNAQIRALHEHVEALFDQHSTAAIYRSQPGIGEILGARILGEFGDDQQRFNGARARKNYAGNSPITRASAKKRTVIARRVRNNRIADPLHQQAFSAPTASPGARAYYDTIRARGAGHHAALRQLSNRLVGILHGCLAAAQPYDETLAWSHHVAVPAD
ncbi:MAG: IS110 family transposase [Pseudonocardiaceae bacterium]|nr:MAG: IS110 family transposase [Pseudonocardiaceae bacterium]